MKKEMSMFVTEATMLPGGGFHSFVCREAIPGSAMNHFSYDMAAHCPTNGELAHNTDRTDRKIPEELIPKIYGCGVKSCNSPLLSKAQHNGRIPM